MRQCIHFRNDDGCWWCDQNLHIELRNGICICDRRLDDDQDDDDDDQDEGWGTHW